MLAVSLIVADVALRHRAVGYENPRRWGGKELLVYSIGCVWSLATWSLAREALWRFVGRPRLFRALRVALAALTAVLISVSFAYLKNFDQAPSWQVLNFAVSEPMWLIRLGIWGLKPSDLVTFLLLGLAVHWLLAPPEAPRVIGKLRRALTRGGAVLYLAFTGLITAVPGMQSPLPVDANAAAAIVQYGLGQGLSQRHLVAPARPPLTSRPHEGQPNVLVIVHESLRADAVFTGLDYANTTLDPKQVSPYQSALVSKRADGFFVFPFARSNATATESSLPSILSGVDLGGESQAYGRAQSLWSVGKARGASTFLFAAEAYSWSHFDEYFIDGNVDKALTGTELSEAVPMGSTSADDGAVVDAAISHLEELTRRRAFFVGAIHFDATHLPGWAGPGTPQFRGEPGEVESYGRAVRYIDGLVERIMGALSRLGLLENTVVLVTSDHGENLIPRRTPDRLGAYYEPTVRIPVWAYVPPPLLQRNPDWGPMLDAWRPGNVQNQDLLPTVRDFLSLRDEPRLNPPHLTGRSLLGPRPEIDQMAGQSTCAFRAWALEGFFLVRGRVKVIVSNDQATPQIYDLEADPKEQRNLWSDPERQREALVWIREAVEAGEERRALCRRIGSVCPVP
ncbi:MAG: sulfatase-like hydrolase/transferase [Polyangiaceae bacterium]|nr:sulfatase-like hydrolase/transferase [Polyangiaceae bacterium]